MDKKNEFDFRTNDKMISYKTLNGNSYDSATWLVGIVCLIAIFIAIIMVILFGCKYCMKLNGYDDDKIFGYDSYAQPVDVRDVIEEEQQSKEPPISNDILLEPPSSRDSEDNGSDDMQSFDIEADIDDDVNLFDLEEFKETLRPKIYDEDDGQYDELININQEQAEIFQNLNNYIFEPDPERMFEVNEEKVYEEKYDVQEEYTQTETQSQSQSKSTRKSTEKETKETSLSGLYE